MWPVFVSALALTLRFPRRLCSAPPMWASCGVVCAVMCVSWEWGGTSGSCFRGSAGVDGMLGVCCDFLAVADHYVRSVVSSVVE
jgi:hypothetical protein